MSEGENPGCSESLGHLREAVMFLLLLGNAGAGRNGIVLIQTGDTDYEYKRPWPRLMCIEMCMNAK